VDLAALSIDGVLGTRLVERNREIHLDGGDALDRLQLEDRWL